MGILIPFSFLCGIVAGILIWRGGELSKRTEEVEARLRGALEKERRNTLEDHDRTSLGIDNERGDDPTREKQTAHTGVRGSSDGGVKGVSFDFNTTRENGAESQDKREEGLASESPVSQTSLKPIPAVASTSGVPQDLETGPLHETSRLISRN